MRLFYRTGRFFVRLTHSLRLFFSFCGHIGSTLVHVWWGRLHISWKTVWKILFYSGPLLVVPLMFVGTLIGISVVLNTYTILGHFALQDKAFIIAQGILTNDLSPFILGFILCGQFSLNLINARLKIAKQQRTPDEVILDFVLPLFIGIPISALLLYTYLFMTFVVSMYISFHYILNFTIGDFLAQIARSITLQELCFSILKTLFYCTIVSFTAGYYYYQIAINHVNLRKAVSRIITRGIFWLTIGSVSMRYLSINY